VTTWIMNPSTPLEIPPQQTPESWSDDDSLTPITNDDTVGSFLPTSKPPNTTRIYFININGITFSPTFSEFHDIASTTKDHGIDILGIAETKLDTMQRRVIGPLRGTARRALGTSHVRLTTSCSDIRYPGTTFKPGGTLLMTHGSTSGRYMSSFSDPLGRWCSQTYTGSNGISLTVISAYQVCSSSPLNTTNNGTLKTKAAATQQYFMMMEAGESSC